MSLRFQILKHLQEYKSITTYEAFTEYGATRLSAIIFDLRKKYKIGDEWVIKVNRWGDEVRFKRYFLINEKRKK